MALSDIITSKHNNERVTVKALVSGRADTTYTVPRFVKMSCAHFNKEKCGPCLVLSKQKQVIVIDSWDVLKFVETSERSFKKIISDLTSLPCNKFSYSITKTKSLLRLFLSENEKTYTCYFAGTDIEVNQLYELSGTVVTDPKTQNATAIFDKAVKLPSQIESFNLCKELHNSLNEFCVTPHVEPIMVHLEKLYASYAANITNIYDRYDLHLSIDLAFRSPLSFTFDGEYFHKGWSDVAIIGDTRVGKGFVAEGFQKYFGVGEVVSGDNATLTGLIGGLKSIDRNWTVKWGKFPHNDGGLLILDESSKLSRYTISHLTRIRSEGIAEIHKIQSYSAPARVRTIFILNPANGKLISHYPYGIQSILSVFKDPATVSRFDYVLVVSLDEADRDAMNKARASVPVMFPQQLEQQLIYWTWSRSNEQIVFSNKAKERIYMLSLDLAGIYSFDVPLIQAENIRYKLAKIAACFAARVYSTKYSGKHLFVDGVHVECAWVFLNMIYKKRPSSYYAMSMIKKSMDAQNEQTGIGAIEKYFASFYQKRLKLLTVILSCDALTMTDLAEQADIRKDIALEVISRLVKYRLIERSGFVYVKTSRFTEWLRTEIMKQIN